MTLIATPAQWGKLSAQHPAITDLLQRLWRLSTMDEQHHLLERVGQELLDLEDKKLAEVMDDAIYEVQAAVNDLQQAVRKMEQIGQGRKA